MNIYDVILCVICAVMLVVLVAGVLLFPSWVRRIDLSKNVKNQPLPRFIEFSFMKIQLKWSLVSVVLFFAALIMFVLAGGVQPRSDDDSPWTALPVVLNFVIILSVGWLLTKYFYRLLVAVCPEAANDNDKRSRVAQWKRVAGFLPVFYVSTIAMFIGFRIISILGLA